MTPEELDAMVDTDPLRLRDEAVRLLAENERLRSALFAAIPWIECICDEDEGTCDGCRARRVAQAALRDDDGTERIG